MNYTFILTCTEDETGEMVGHVEAKTLESIEEQFRKVEAGIETYEEKQKDFGQESI